MSGFALFAERWFKTSDGLAWTSREVGYMFAYSGFLGIILQGGILGRLVKKVGEPPLAVAGFVAAAISSFGNGVLRPVITSEITQAVGRHEQGVAIGISGSLNSLAMTVAPPVGG